MSCIVVKSKGLSTSKRVWVHDTIVSVVSIALGIGANTAIFTLVDQVLLRQLPVSQPEQLVS
jgi:hypothetical protein